MIIQWTGPTDKGQDVYQGVDGVWNYSSHSLQNYAHTMSGGAVVGGSAPGTIEYATVTMDGGPVMSGTWPAQRDFALEWDGGVEIDSIHTIVAAHGVTMAGGPVLSSLSSVIHTDVVLVNVETRLILKTGNQPGAYSETKAPNLAINEADPDAPLATTWGTPEGVYGVGGSAAVAAVSSTSRSQRLKMTTFNFALPAAAIVTGFLVRILRKSTPAGHVARDYSLRLVIGGNVTGENKAKTEEEWPSDYTWMLYGGDTDLFNTAPSAGDVNALNFGLSLQAIGKSGAPGANVDAVELTVYWSPAPAWVADVGVQIGAITGASAEPTVISTVGLASTAAVTEVIVSASSSLALDSKGTVAEGPLGYRGR